MLTVPCRTVLLFSYTERREIMKYIVRTEGKVLDYRQTAYTVNAEREQTDE